MKADQVLNQGKLPTWAVSLIALVISVYLGVFAVGVRLALVAKDILEQANDPNKIKEVAQEIAKFPALLPTNYHYVLGLDLGPLKMVTIEHEPDKQQILLVCQVGLYDRGTSAKDVVSDIYDSGINIPTNGRTISGHFVSRKSHGEVEVAGEKMCYIVGEISASENKKLEGMVGCILASNPKNIQRTILISAVEPNGQPYSLEETVGLLNCLSGF